MKVCPQCNTGYPDGHITCPTHGAYLSEIIDLKPGMVIRNTYRIERKLGEGGFGTVYLAEHILMGEQRALKFLSRQYCQDEAATARFRREVRTLHQLRNCNVVDCGDLEQAEDGTLFFPMEYVDGPDLHDFMDRAPKPFDMKLALAITRGIASGLGAAHAKGLVHRDIKPQNILMAREGDAWVPKIADFGIVATKESRTTSRGITSASMLTWAYAAPEQWMGMRSDKLDGRADFYALGGVLYEMLTGQTAFDADSYEGWAEQHKNTAPKPPSSVRPELANWKGLDGLVLRMLARDRDLRHKDVAELLGLLDAVEYLPAGQRRETVRDDSTNRKETVAEKQTIQPKPASAPPPPHPRSFLKWAVAAGLLVVGLGIWLVVRSASPMPATAAPVLTPDGGVYAETQLITISDATPEAIIHYTVDGSSPTEASPVYTHPIASLPSGSAIVRAMATAKDHTPSSVSRAGVYAWSGSTQSSVTPTPNNPESAPIEPKSAPRNDDSGTWTDPATGLMWQKRDNGSDVNWQQATNYCQNLSLGGYTGWRLPGIDELQAIYDPNRSEPDWQDGKDGLKYHVKGQLQLSNSTERSNTQANASGAAWTFNFVEGKRYSDYTPASAAFGIAVNVLCVRRSRE